MNQNTLTTLSSSDLDLVSVERTRPPHSAWCNTSNASLYSKAVRRATVVHFFSDDWYGFDEVSVRVYRHKSKCMSNPFSRISGTGLNKFGLG